MNNPMKVIAITMALTSGMLCSIRAEAAEIPGPRASQEETLEKLAAYEQVRAALRSERHKFKAGKSSLFVVHSAVRDLRDAELRMSTTALQRIAALVRYTELVRELEGDAVSALDRVVNQNWRQIAESDLSRAKRE